MLICKLFNKIKIICENVAINIKCVVSGIPCNCIVQLSVKVISSKIEGRVKIDANTKIRNSEIGFGSFVAGNSNIVRCKIGKYSLVGFNSLIGAHPIHNIASIHPALYSTKGQYGYTYVKKDNFDEYKDADDNGYAIVIGNDVWATGDIKIIQGITIGDGAVVMSAAVVTKNVPPYAIVAGIPAKIIGYRFSEGDIGFLLKLCWWDRGEEWIKAHAEYFSSVENLKKVVLSEEPNFYN